MSIFLPRRSTQRRSRTILSRERISLSLSVTRRRRKRKKVYPG
jgi:hypothetical protein